MRKTALLFMTLVMTAASAQQKPTTGYATVSTRPPAPPQ